MKTVSLPDKDGASYSPEGFTRTENGETIVNQAMVPTTPAGALLDLATQATLAELKNVSDNILTAASAIKNAVESLNTKTTAVNTGAIAGTVSVSNLPATQSVSAVALPLPAGASTEATLVAVKNSLDVLTGNTDTVEALQTTTNASLVTLQNYVDTVESLLTSLSTNTDGVEALLNTLGVQTDQVEPLLGNIQTATEAVRDKLPVLNNGKLPVEVNAGAQPLPVDSQETLLLRQLSNVLTKLTYTLNGLRVDATLSATQALGTIAAVTAVGTINAANNVALGNISAMGMGILMSQLNCNGFRDRIT